MMSFLRWLAFLGRLIVAYTLLGLCAGFIAFLVIAAYASPKDLAFAASGFALNIVYHALWRSYWQARQEGREFPLWKAFRTLTSDDVLHHGRRSAT